MKNMAKRGKRGFIQSVGRGNNIYPNRYAVIYIAPAIILMIGMCVFPVILLFYNSLTNYSLMMPQTSFVGFDNYAEVFRSKEILHNIKLTLQYVVAAVTVEVLLGFFLAMISQIRTPFKKLIRTIIILPMVATPAAMCYVWSFMYHPNMGVINYLISLFGIGPQLWASAPESALMSVVLIDIWINTPFCFLIFSAGISAMPQDSFEAAIVDGASFLQLIRYILIPLTKPILMIVLLFRIIDAFKAFDLIFVLTGGGPGTATQTLNVAVYLNAFSFYRVGYASAIAVLLWLFILLLSVILVRLGDLDFK